MRTGRPLNYMLDSTASRARGRRIRTYSALQDDGESGDVRVDEVAPGKVLEAFVLRRNDARFVDRGWPGTDGLAEREEFLRDQCFIDLRLAWLAN